MHRSCPPTLRPAARSAIVDRQRSRLFDRQASSWMHHLRGLLAAGDPAVGLVVLGLGPLPVTSLLVVRTGSVLNGTVAAASALIVLLRHRSAIGAVRYDEFVTTAR